MLFRSAVVDFADAQITLLQPLLILIAWYLLSYQGCFHALHFYKFKSNHQPLESRTNLIIKQNTHTSKIIENRTRWKLKTQAILSLLIYELQSIVFNLSAGIRSSSLRLLAGPTGSSSSESAIATSSANSRTCAA